MREQKLFVAILIWATVALGSCQERDADSARKASELERSRGSYDKGAPGNPRGPTDPSR
jgi:hypothetical protein